MGLSAQKACACMLRCTMLYLFSGNAPGVPPACVGGARALCAASPLGGKQKRYGVALCGVRHPPDAGPYLFKFLFYGFIAAVEVVDPLHMGFSLGGKPGDDQ